MSTSTHIFSLGSPFVCSPDSLGRDGVVARLAEGSEVLLATPGPDGCDDLGSSFGLECSLTSLESISPDNLVHMHLVSSIERGIGYHPSMCGLNAKVRPRGEMPASDSDNPQNAIRMHGAGSVGAGGELHPRMSVSPDPASRGGLASGNRDMPSYRLDKERIKTPGDDRKGFQPLFDSCKPALNALLDMLLGASVGSDAESHLTVAGVRHSVSPRTPRTPNHLFWEENVLSL